MMLSKALLVIIVAAPQLVLGQILGFSTSTTCFQSGPTVNFTQAAFTVPDACVTMVGSFI